ncbi:aminopeptidase [Gemmatimonadetes bacterium T265]|nr:aminopeptidase [Gemmatimonadetes bacterium T265]
MPHAVRRPTLATPALRRAAHLGVALAWAGTAARAGARPVRPAPPIGPGVPAALARWRAARVRDVRYALAFDLTGHDTATGHVEIRFTRLGGDDVVLDWRGLRLANARANDRPVAVSADGEHVRVPAAALRAGANVLAFDVAAAVAPAGASVIRYHDATDGADYLYTLLVPGDAHALFPCFDQPDLKARVTLALRVPAGWTAVANGAAADSAADTAPSNRLGARTFRFAETRPVSTYLVAFAAGPWATVRRTAAGRAMTLYVRRSRAAEVEADSILDANGRGLAWLERYFARPYPFGKFDAVLAPAFPFGGMEHPGAVFYNEETFIFRERPTLPQRLARTATVYHEVAHQWFGDLVTMRWFDDLWLKEGFATYMAAKMQADLDPASEAWKTFYLRNKPAAYAVDASPGTTPVYQALANLDQAKSNYGAIVYNKAPGVLKQLEYVVGPAAFRAGLRDYLAAHAYGNATWQDLLASVGRAAGRDLGAWGAAYILRPGLPVLEAVPNASAVVVTQRPAQPAVSGPAPWPVRAELLVRDDGDPAGAAPLRRPASLTARATRVPLPGAPNGPGALVFPNARDEAYALVLLDSASVGWTERHVSAVGDGLLRAQLWGALWDLAREARYAPTRFLALAERALPAERDEQVAQFVLARVARAATRWLGPAQRVALLPGLEAALARAADDTARPYGIRKAHLDALVAVTATPAGLAALDARLDSATAAGAPLRPPTRWAIVTTLVTRGAPSAERRLADETRHDSTSEGRRRAFVAGAARPNAGAKADYFRRYFADRALNEEWVTASLPAFAAPGQEALALPYVAPALDSLPWVQKNRRIFFLGSWLDALVGAQTRPEALAAVDAFLAAHPALPADLRRKVLQSADELRRTVAVRARFAPDAE